MDTQLKDIRTFDDVREEFVRNFKTKLNEFMYSHVPPKLTISEFEELTCDIHARVFKEWDKFI